MYFFYVDYGILYEELLVRAKKTQFVLHIYDLQSNFRTKDTLGMGLLSLSRRLSLSLSSSCFDYKCCLNRVISAIDT